MQRAINIKSIPLPRLPEREEDSDAKNTVSGSVCRGEGWRTAVQTPGAFEITTQNFGASFKDCSTCLDCCHLRNGFSCNIETFSHGTICPTRLRRHYEGHVPNSRVIHGRVIVSHSWHLVPILTAVVLSFRSRMALTHDRANTVGRNNPRQ
jgi:hypothetical protein